MRTAAESGGFGGRCQRFRLVRGPVFRTTGRDSVIQHGPFSADRWHTQGKIRCLLRWAGGLDVAGVGFGSRFVVNVKYVDTQGSSSFGPELRSTPQGPVKTVVACARQAYAASYRRPGLMLSLLRPHLPTVRAVSSHWRFRRDFRGCLRRMIRKSVECSP